MHLIVMTEAAQGCPAPEAPQDKGQLQALIERWNPLMTRLVPGWALNEDPDALNTLAERAQARLALGSELHPDDDGRLPLEAWSAAAEPAATVQGTQPTPAPMARLTPFHGLVGSDRITLVPPAELHLSEVESRELYAAVQPLFNSEGVSLSWRSALHWRVAHESLRGLPCASLTRAEGDSVQRWQGRTPLSAARLLRRLQNEAQMVLHDHPVNQARTERRELSVNSLWLDHAGAAGDLAVESAAAGESATRTLQQRWRDITLTPLAHANAALQAWVDAALSPTTPPIHEPVLVLCGRHAAQSFTMRRLPGGWRGAIARTLQRPPRTLPLPTWLQQVDAPAPGGSA